MTKCATNWRRNFFQTYVLDCSWLEMSMIDIKLKIKKVGFGLGHPNPKKSQPKRDPKVPNSTRKSPKFWKISQKYIPKSWKFFPNWTQKSQKYGICRPKNPQSLQNFPKKNPKNRNFCHKKPRNPMNGPKNPKKPKLTQHSRDWNKLFQWNCDNLFYIFFMYFIWTESILPMTMLRLATFV